MILYSKIFLNLYKYKRKFISERNISSKLENSTKLKILFFGTDNFSLPSLKKLYGNQLLNSSKIDSISVVTSFKNPSNQVKIFAENENLTIHRWPVCSEVCKKFDLGVVVSFGHLIPNSIIKAFSFGMINVHASILPRWRGAAPIIYAIMKGDTTTGVSIMKIEPKHFDIGDILARSCVDISPTVLLPELHNQLANEGASLLLSTVENIPESLNNSLKQDNQLVTYAPKITPKLTEVSWTGMTAVEVYNLFRALYSYKHLVTSFLNHRFKIIDMKLDVAVTKDNNCKASGSVEFVKSKKCLRVTCKDGKFIEVYSLRVDGKKNMNALDFNNGFLKKVPPELRVFK